MYYSASILPASVWKKTKHSSPFSNSSWFSKSYYLFCLSLCFKSKSLRAGTAVKEAPEAVHC